jgi:hypothetical protein
MASPKKTRSTRRSIKKETAEEIKDSLDDNLFPLTQLKGKLN